MLKASQHNQSTAQVIYRLLDLVTFVAPPGVPLLLLVLSAVAMIRLRKLGLVLLHGEVVKQGAAVDVVCFDKTGTLTHSTVSLTPRFVRLLACSLTCTHSLAHSHKLTRPVTQSYSFTHLLARSLTPSLTHSFTPSLPPLLTP